ncbi:MAG: SOS-response repressor and protease LexA [uncultured Thermomicrobiales bacterium]|uniref:LexA repressor n=1 Tax=uncultured Thermomicrobiales bacterium TaxID=1645740 RepID=A0A6J4UER5_9BACT|nr:MAG: SOS-response repressor and protease LexA [uncultured Thermomicrobiales bacterium]
MKALSRRQQAIYDFIARFLDENDYPPTIRDIQRELGISSTSVVDYNLKVLEERSMIRRNRNISRGIEVLGRHTSRRNVVSIPVIGQIAAGLPIPVPDDLALGDSTDMVEIGSDIVGNAPRDLFALRVKGHSMVDALINDGDIVLLHAQETCENGETVAVWLKEQKETTLKRFYLEGDRVRLQPANVTMDPIYTTADNVAIQGKLVSVVRSII